jgi:hypothetical protein
MRYTLSLLLLVACGDATGPSGYDFPEIVVSVSLRPQGSQCSVSFLATAKNRDDTVQYILYAPGALGGAPTSGATGRTPIGATTIVASRDFRLDWQVSGPTYYYAAPNPGVVHC